MILLNLDRDVRFKEAANARLRGTGPGVRASAWSGCRTKDSTARVRARVWDQVVYGPGVGHVPVCMHGSGVTAGMHSNCTTVACL